MSVSVSVFVVGWTMDTEAEFLYRSGDKIWRKFSAKLPESAECAVAQMYFLEVLGRSDCDREWILFFSKMFWDWSGLSCGFNDLPRHLQRERIISAFLYDKIPQSMVARGLDEILPSLWRAYRDDKGKYFCSEDELLEYGRLWINVLLRAVNEKKGVIVLSDC